MGGGWLLRAGVRQAIIFAGGPFTDQMRKLEDPAAPPAVAGAAGTHIVLPAYYMPRGMGLLDINTSDGRFLFMLPWMVCLRAPHITHPAATPCDV